YNETAQPKHRVELPSLAASRTQAAIARQNAYAGAVSRRSKKFGRVARPDDQPFAAAPVEYQRRVISLIASALSTARTARPSKSAPMWSPRTGSSSWRKPRSFFLSRKLTNVAG